MFTKLLTAAAIASMATAPVLAASPASKLSLSSRAVTKAKKSNDVQAGVVIGVLAAAAVIGGVIILASEDDTPDSP